MNYYQCHFSIIEILLVFIDIIQVFIDIFLYFTDIFFCYGKYKIAVCTHILKFWKTDMLCLNSKRQITHEPNVTEYIYIFKICHHNLFYFCQINLDN